jgi:maltose O-acetyltransferase
MDVGDPAIVGCVTGEPDRFVAEALRSVRVDVSLAGFGLLANVIAGSILVPRVLRVPLLRIAGIKVGRAHVWPGVFFGYPRVRIGNRATVNRGCFFDSYGGVTIGDNAHVGYDVKFLGSTHEIGPSSHRCGRAYSEPIAVENGAWIGAGSILLPGVTVGAGCIVAAGSVVTKDCEPDGLYAGAPARRIRDLPL